jgi:hypothetical protein
MEKHPEAQGKWKLDKEQDGTGQVNSRELVKVRNAAIIGSVAVPDIYLEYVISHCTWIQGQNLFVLPIVLLFLVLLQLFCAKLILLYYQLSYTS